MAFHDLGWIAASFILAVFCDERIAGRGTTAILSSVATGSYVHAAYLWPILVLGSIMLGAVSLTFSPAKVLWGERRCGRAYRSFMLRLLPMNLQRFWLFL